MERVTHLFYEAEMAMEKFGLTYDQWLQKPEKVRIFQLAVYRLSQAKKSYYNTPSEKRFAFFKGSN